MSLLRSVGVLVSGTALGHGITAAALPVLSRLYTPAEFSLLAVFAGVVSVISVAACLRFDIAIALPREDSEAFDLLLLSIGFALLTSVALLILVLLVPDWIAYRLKQPALLPYLWLIPVSVLLAGSYSALQMWFVRHKGFHLIARSRVAQSAASAGVQISSGALGTGPVGLFVGHAINTGAACFVLGYRLLKERRHAVCAPLPTWARLRGSFKAYDRFPKYSTWEALCNSAAIQLPVILIAALAAPAEAGYLMLATYVMQAPMALIGNAVGQVYLSRAAEEHRQGQLSAFTAGILHGLVKAGVGPLLAAGIIAPAAFGLVFGADWGRAGVLVAWMTPWFILQFLVGPISMALHVTGHQRAAFALQVVGLVTRVLGVWLTAQWFTHGLSEAYALTGLGFYTLYLLVVLHYTQVRLGIFVRILRDNAPIVALYGVAAAAAAMVLSRLLPP